MKITIWESGCRTVVAATVLAACLSVSAQADKFIASGWEFGDATADGLLAKAEALDALPIDGCVLFINRKGTDGAVISSRNIVHQRAWTDADLAPDVPKFKELLKHRAFRHSFLKCYQAPTNRIAWTDDAAWSRIANNIRLAARFAKTCGFVGIMIDPEDYKRQRQYNRQPADGLDYLSLAKLVRQRARQVFGGAYVEFPDAKLLTYFLLSMEDTYMLDVSGKHLRDHLLRQESDLWPHFVDGILDVLPPTATVIEGNESAYNWEASKKQYYSEGIHTRNELPYLLSPENRTKYRCQVRTSFGVYLDGYSRHTKGMYYMEPLYGSRLTHLRLNLLQAADAADEYLWLWGEKGAWKGRDSGTWTTWEKQLPGLTDTLLVIRDPAELGRRLHVRMLAGELKPLNANVACVGTDAGIVPKPYASWFDSHFFKREGKFGCDLTQGDGDSSSLVVEGCEKGCLYLFNLVDEKRRYHSGDVFGLSFSARGRHISAVVSWKRDGKWDWSIRRMLVPVNPQTNPDTWTRTDWSFVLPERADGFGVMLQVQQESDEKSWFDNIVVLPAILAEK